MLFHKKRLYFLENVSFVFSIEETNFLYHILFNLATDSLKRVFTDIDRIVWYNHIDFFEKKKAVK